MLKETKAFTLIELVIGMAVMAVLMFLGIIGINILQQTTRDSQRTTKLAEISTVINDYKRKNLSLPDQADVTFQQGKFSIVGFDEIELTGILTPAAETNGVQTRYYYNNLTNQNFLLCVQLESGNVKGAGTSECPPVTNWQ
jgi:prepilin-type N-terminal cleavage/methylation domain-containing protein